ncbi:MAG: response regulator [Deltaproteobacteria bacterium]
MTGKKIRVVIANENAALCDTMEDLIKDVGAEVVKVFDGVKAVEAVETWRPDLLIIDVALPKLYGFAVCDHVKKNPELKGTKVLLLTTLFDRKRYTRDPASLYGADDYVETHALAAELLPKVKHVLDIERSVNAPSAAAVVSQAAGVPAQSAGRAEVKERQIVEKVESAKQAMTTGSEEAHARRLARLIVSDIILYTDIEVEDAIKRGRFYETLKEEIREGIRYFKKKVSTPGAAEKYLKDAFEEFLSKKRKELGII